MDRGRPRASSSSPGVVPTAVSMDLVVRFPDTLRSERAYAARVVFEEHLGLAHEVVFEDRLDVLVHPPGDRARAVSLLDHVFADGEADWPARARRPEPISDEVLSGSVQSGGLFADS